MRNTSDNKRLHMEQTLPPLVSDEYLSSLTPISQDWKDGPRTPVTPTEVRDIYEAERSKLLDKITRLEGTTNFEVVPKEQYDRALEMYKHAIEVSPKSAQNYTRAGVALKNLKSIPEAVVALERAVVLDPKNLEATKQLAVVSAMNLVSTGTRSAAPAAHA